MTLQIRAQSVICCSVKNNATLGMAKDNDEQNEQPLWLTTPLNKFFKMLHLY